MCAFVSRLWLGSRLEGKLRSLPQLTNTHCMGRNRDSVEETCYRAYPLRESKPASKTRQQTRESHSVKQLFLGALGVFISVSSFMIFLFYDKMPFSYFQVFIKAVLNTTASLSRDIELIIKKSLK